MALRFRNPLRSNYRLHGNQLSVIVGGMDYEQFAQTHFAGNVSAIAREFGVTRAAVQSWKRKKQIPELRAAQLELWLLKREAEKKQ